MELSVAVVGAGPAGSWLAYKLSNRGHAVTVFQEPNGPRGYCAGGLGIYAEERLRRLSPYLSEALDHATLQRVEEITLVVSNHADVAKEVSVTAGMLGLDRLGIVIDRERFDRLLLKYAAKAGAKIVYKHIDPRHLVGVYDIVVDARGFSAWHGNECSHMVFTQQWWPEIRSEKWGSAMAIMFDTVLHEGYFWYFPAGSRGAKYGFGERAFVYPGAKKEILRVAEKLWGVRPWEHRGKVYAAVLPLCGASYVRLRNGRIFYVGTAAGLIDPATGAGIRYAVESANALARAIRKRLTLGMMQHIYRAGLTRVLAEIRFMEKIRDRLLSNTYRAMIAERLGELVGELDKKPGLKKKLKKLSLYKFLASLAF